MKRIWILAAAAVPICMSIAHATPQGDLLVFAFYSEFVGEKFRATCQEAGVKFDNDFARTQRARSQLVDIATERLDPAEAEMLLTSARSEGEHRANELTVKLLGLSENVPPARRREFNHIICMTEIRMAVRQLGDIILMAGGAEKLFQKGFARKRGEPTP